MEPMRQSIVGLAGGGGGQGGSMLVVLVLLVVILRLPTADIIANVTGSIGLPTIVFIWIRYNLINGLVLVQYFRILICKILKSNGKVINSVDVMEDAITDTRCCI